MRARGPRGQPGPPGAGWPDIVTRAAGGADGEARARGPGGRRGGGAHAPERAPVRGSDSPFARPWAAAGSRSAFRFRRAVCRAGVCAAITCRRLCPPSCPPPGRPPPRSFSFMDWEIQGTDGQKPLQVSEVLISNISALMHQLCL